MSRSDEQRIADLLEAADELAAIVRRGREAFDSDPVLRRASERLLEIIGEAANGLTEATTARYPGSHGGTSPGSGSCSPITITASTRPRSG